MSIIFITINHLDDFDATEFLRVNQKLHLKKDHNNPYDDEAILVFDSREKKIGYVANSVSTVCRGTHSAGRVYDKFDEETYAVVRFVAGESDFAIAEMISKK